MGINHFLKPDSSVISSNILSRNIWTVNWNEERIAQWTI